MALFTKKWIITNQIFSNNVQSKNHLFQKALSFHRGKNTCDAETYLAWVFFATSKFFLSIERVNGQLFIQSLNLILRERPQSRYVFNLITSPKFKSWNLNFMVQVQNPITQYYHFDIAISPPLTMYYVMNLLIELMTTLNNKKRKENPVFEPLG